MLSRHRISVSQLPHDDGGRRIDPMNPGIEAASQAQHHRVSVTREETPSPVVVGLGAHHGGEAHLAGAESAFVVFGIESAHGLLGVLVAEDRVRQPVVQCLGPEDGAESLLHADELGVLHPPKLPPVLRIPGPGDQSLDVVPF